MPEATQVVATQDADTVILTPEGFRDSQGYPVSPTNFQPTPAQQAKPRVRAYCLYSQDSPAQSEVGVEDTPDETAQQQERCAVARACPCGASHFTSKSIGARKQCSDCKTWKRRGTKAWGCEHCKKIVCLQCRNLYPRWGEREVDWMIREAESSVPRQPQMSDKEAVHEILEEVRSDPRGTVPPDIPARAKKRFGRLGRDLIRNLLGTIAASGDDFSVRLNSLMLLYACPAILGHI